MNKSHLHTRVPRLAWPMLVNSALVARGLRNLNVGQRICLPMDQFYHPRHSVAIFVFPVNMAPYSLCFYLFYVLLNVGERGQITKSPFFIHTVRLGPCGCCSKAFPVLTSTPAQQADNPAQWSHSLCHNWQEVIKTAFRAVNYGSW